MSTPQTQITLCSNTGLNNRYEHSIYFASPSAQLAYFTSKKVRVYTNYTYTRRAWTLKVGASMPDAYKWDYMFFKNFTDGKTYFYFVKGVEYVNDSTVELSFELDVIQTYLFDWKLRRCFIERQHSSSDEIGENLVDESIDTGELTSTSSEDLSYLNDLCILVMSTFYPSSGVFDKDNVVSIYGKKLNGVFSGVGIFAQSAESAHVELLASCLKGLDEQGLTDGILSIWMYPKTLVKLKDGLTWSDARAFMEVDNMSVVNKNSSRPVTFGDYTPKNKKLLCYPYNFLYITNNSGGSAVYRYERFSTPSVPSFEVSGTYSPEGVVRITPKNYDGESLNYDKGLTLGGFPTCAWNSDTYKIWLAQNQNQQNQAGVMGGLTIVGGVASAAVGVATGNAMMVTAGLGATVGGIQQVASLVNAQKDREIQPNEARGSHSAGVNIVNKKQTFTLIQKQVTPEYARIIDDFFTMYGYAVKRIGIPNINARSSFTYVKTVGCHIRGAIANEDATKIEGIFDKGITFWKNGSTIGDYAVTNTPLGTDPEFEYDDDGDE